MRAIVITYIGNEIPDNLIEKMITAPEAPTMAQVVVTKLNDSEVAKLSVPSLVATGLNQNVFAPHHSRSAEDSAIYNAFVYINKLFGEVKNDPVKLTLQIISFRQHHDMKTVGALDNAMKILSEHSISPELKAKFRFTQDTVETIRKIYKNHVL